MESTVKVRCYQRVKNLYSGADEGPAQDQFGSGVVIPSVGTSTPIPPDRQGQHPHLILTCYHVVAGARMVGVEVPTRGPQRHSFEVVTVCPTHDLAVLFGFLPFQIPPAVLGDSDTLRPNDPVVATGFPLLAHEGVVSVPGTVKRYLSSTSRVEVSIGINQGQSGGGLFTRDGNRLVGIISQKFAGTAENSGICVPIIFWRLMGMGTGTPVVHPAELGVCCQGITEHALTISPLLIGGCMVTCVVPEGPAQAAGIHAGDIITSIEIQGARYHLRGPEGMVPNVPWSTSPVPLNDVLRRIPMHGVPVKVALLRLSLCSQPSTHIDVTVMADARLVHGVRRFIAIGLEPWPVVQIAGMTFTYLRRNFTPEHTQNVDPRIMAILAALTPQDAGRSRIIASEVHADSQAASVGIEVGCELVRVNDQPIHSLRELIETLTHPICGGTTCLLEFAYLGLRKFVLLHTAKQLQYEQTQPHYRPCQTVLDAWARTTPTATAATATTR